MKYLLKGNDMVNANYGRVLLTDDNKVFLKDFSPYQTIDLGLPSGTLWADRNIGATDIYDGGKLFQWGDPTPYDIPEHTDGMVNGGQKMFYWSDYKWNPSGDSSTFTKYNETDRKITLDPEDDAAHVNMGGTWKMPTEEQVTELFKETTLELYAKLTDDSGPVKVADGVSNGYTHVLWKYVDGHTSGEASGKLTYMKLRSKSNGNFLVVPSSVGVYNGHVANYCSVFSPSAVVHMPCHNIPFPFRIPLPYYMTWRRPSYTNILPCLSVRQVSILPRPY